MITILADNILSPLGTTTEANLKAVREGLSALKEHHTHLPEPFVASLFDQPFADIEEGIIRSIKAALSGTNLDSSSHRVIFILSSTKGNVALLDGVTEAANVPGKERLGYSALDIARHFHNPNTPIVVSNACISGLSAQILAMRLLESGTYDYAIVSGTDIQSDFIVSGFQSFKALSPDPCRPFDGDRCGLNLGEAVATMILQRSAENAAGWAITRASVRNDACHISNPSRTAEGCYRAICSVMGGLLASEGVSETKASELACISAHGTATLYNDEMEAVALDRAGLQEVPVFSLKGYYGHTMGAAGILETIITFHAVEEGWIPATRGYAEAGTCREINVTAAEQPTSQRRFLKLLSGFGGCNAAALFEKNPQSHPSVGTYSMTKRKQVQLTPDSFPEGMNACYKQQIGDYPKFYKMDPLCKLGFLAAEQLLAGETVDPERTAIVIVNRSGSLADDLAYQVTIQHKTEEEYFPSPSVFVYTLSNIVTGEIAIRHGIFGETSCYILDEKDSRVIDQLILSTFHDQGIDTVIGGWVEYRDKEHYEADLSLCQRE